MAERIKEGLRILMVDDSPDDVFFVKKALEQTGVGKFFYAVHSVEHAIKYLRAEGEYADRDRFPFPNTLLMDLKMPCQGGFELLEWLQKHPECKVIPTIVFSSSPAESDIQRVYVLGGNAFLVKPGSFQGIIEVIRATYSFWSQCETPAPPPGDRCD